MNDDELSLFMALRTGCFYVIVCGTKRLNPFYRLHEASEVLNINGSVITAAFFVNFIVTVFVPNIKGTHNKIICL